MNDPYALTCPCSCHGGGQWARCDWDGGCHHLHNTTGSDPHERRCARAATCPDGQRVTLNDNTKIRVGAQLTTPTGLCPTCTIATRTVINGLLTDYDDCTRHLRPGDATPGDKVNGTPETPLPLRTALHDLAEHIVTIATTWAEPVAEHTGIDWDSRKVDRHTRRRVALARAVDVLEPNLNVLLALPPTPIRVWADDGIYHTIEEHTGLDAALEFHTVHRLTELHLGRTHLQHRLPVRCPRCGCRTLVRDNGADNVHCTRHCGRWTEEQYRWLTTLAVTVEQQRATPVA